MALKQKKTLKKYQPIQIYPSGGNYYFRKSNDGNIGKTYEKEHAELFIALWNSAIKINPTNPMALARNTETIVKVLKWLDDCRLGEPMESKIHNLLKEIRKRG